MYHVRHPGIDTFFTDPGQDTERHCHACGTLCTVTRNVNGPTGLAEGMARARHLHDRFECPHADQEWHLQAVRYVQEIGRAASPRVAALIQQDLDDLLGTQGIPRW